ncbi:MAG: signal recognition particle protein Srp54 [Candidatus Woesearchaeota archaeon]
MLEKFSDSLKKTLKKIAGASLVDERLVDELVKDIQRALLSSDVNVKHVFELSKGIKKKALEKDIPKGMNYRDYLVKIVYDELVKFLGGERKGIKISKKKPFKIMMVGLFASGKTTNAAKIAKYYMKRGYKIALIGLDVHRPAAMDQIKQMAEKINAPFFIDKQEKDPLKIWNRYEKDLAGFDIVIIDTAGRDALSEDLVKEIENLNKKIKPDEKLLVMSADIGQAAEKQADQFNKSCDITGVVVTKLDGTARGGGALTGTVVTGAPIKFIGVGEGVDDLEEFNPEGFVGRLLGMGDIEALLEKAKESMSAEQAEDLGKKFLKGDFNFLDMYEQMQAMKKMGPLSKIMDMIPGMGQMKLPKDVLNVQEGKLKKWKVIMQSMTKEELEDPDKVFSRTRIERIAKGSGCTAGDVRELLKHYRQSKKIMKMMKGDPEKMMKKFQKRMPK